MGKYLAAMPVLASVSTGVLMMINLYLCTYQYSRFDPATRPLPTISECAGRAPEFFVLRTMAGLGAVLMSIFAAFLFRMNYEGLIWMARKQRGAPCCCGMCCSPCMSWCAVVCWVIAASCLVAVGMNSVYVHLDLHNVLAVTFFVFLFTYIILTEWLTSFTSPYRLSRTLALASLDGSLSTTDREEIERSHVRWEWYRWLWAFATGAVFAALIWVWPKPGMSYEEVIQGFARGSEFEHLFVAGATTYPMFFMSELRRMHWSAPFVSYSLADFRAAKL